MDELQNSLKRQSQFENGLFLLLPETAETEHEHSSQRLLLVHDKSALCIFSDHNDCHVRVHRATGLSVTRGHTNC